MMMMMMKSGKITIMNNVISCDIESCFRGKHETFFYSISTINNNNLKISEKTNKQTNKQPEIFIFKIQITKKIKRNRPIMNL
mgnify:CR=1 FL=1